MPLVSVIIPAYNALRWLPQTLASVACQDWPHMQVIVVDDGSTDETQDYIRTTWPHFHLECTPNRGVSHARNLGTTLATGEYVQYLDADDLLTPGKIRRHVELLQAHPHADIVYGDWQRLIATPDGRFEAGETIHRTYADIHPDPEIAFFTDMWCPTGAYLYRRTFLPRVLPWKEWLPVIQDARFALDCARAGAQWLHDPQLTVLYRQHLSGSISTLSQIAKLRDCLANSDNVYELWEHTGHLTPERRRVLLDQYLYLGQALIDFDQASFDHVHRQLLRLDPHFTPKGKLRTLLTRLLGYPATERLAAWRRKFQHRRHR